MRAENYSTRYTVTWKAKTTKRSRRLFFQLALSGRRTAGTASGLLPTSQSRDYRSGKARKDYGNVRPLNEVVLLPTVTRRDRESLAKVTRGKHAMPGGTPLALAVQEVVPGQLNPDWVEIFLGYPLGWTRGVRDGKTESREPQNA
jgi:hypothetical protein